MEDSLVHYDYAPDISVVTVGKEVCIVARPVCMDFQTNLHCMVSEPYCKSFRFHGGLPPDMVTYSLMRVMVQKQGPTPLLVSTEFSTIWGNQQATWEDARNVVELCSGMGGIGQGAKAALFRPVVACDMRERMLELYKMHGDVHAVCGDITRISTLHEVHRAHPKGSSLAAGISCQPYSALGDGRSGDDYRSLTLPAVLAAGHFLRSIAIILECVEPAGKDAFVRWHVDQFCIRTGFHKAETILHLHDIWPCKRSRWWCILTAPALGPVDLKAFPKIPDLPSVKHVIPRIIPWESESEKALRLTAVEIEAFSQYGDGCAAHLLNFSGVMPCALHAWGSQTSPCPCGCRLTGLSKFRLQSRGLHGVLVRCAGGSGDIEGGAFRHLHPKEAACLCGMDPCLDWGSEPRLSLGAIGQFASPLHAFWVFIQLSKQFETIHHGSWTLQPYSSLLAYRSWLLSRAKRVWESVSSSLPASEALSMSSHWNMVQHMSIDDLFRDGQGILQMFESLKAKHSLAETTAKTQTEEVKVPTDLTVEQVIVPTPTEICDSNEIADAVGTEMVVVMVWFEEDGHQMAPTQVRVSSGTKIQSLLEAEMELQSCDKPCKIHTGDGLPVSLDFEILQQMDIHFVLQGDTPGCQNEDGEEKWVPEPAESVTPLVKVEGNGFLDLEGPCVADCVQAHALRAQTISSSERLKILHRQGAIWGDDELVWHLAKIQNEWNVDQHPGSGMPYIIDPLLLKGWQQELDCGHIAMWFESNERPLYVMTVVPHKQHWIPLVCYKSSDSLEAVYLRTRPADQGCIAKLASLITDAMHAEVCQITPVEGISLAHSCGAQAISFLRHVVLGGLFADSEAVVKDEHVKLRQMFVSAISNSVATCHPWIWGAGNEMEDQAVQMLRPILKEHGVHPDKLQARALQAVKAIGSEDVVAACKSQVPWRALKAIGNNVKFQFILPDELQQKIAQKAGGLEVGRSVKKTKAKQTSKRDDDIQLDPTKLALPEGVFHCSQQPLNQIPLTQVGPVAEGVAVVTATEAEPFVKAGKFVSAGPLALLVLHAPAHMWSTLLPHNEVMVPARCVVNQEPLLLHATLVQLGDGKVEKTAVVATQQIKPAQVVTIKATVYKDEVGMPWDQIVSGPVKYVLKQFPCLRLCSEPHCQCEAWHNEEHEPVQTPVLDVWRRQFLRSGFKQAPHQDATMFSVCFRIPQCLLERLLAMSGSGGVYLEPRSLDAKEVDRNFDIIWVPKADKQTLQHLRQTTPASLGIARVAERYGLRVRSEQAQAVHQSIRPDAVFLAQGPRLQFSVGPIPYGTDRQALSKALKGCNWDAKPIQPVGSVDGGKGNTWTVHSTKAPPTNILHMTHGEVVISTLKTPDTERLNVRKPFGAAATLNLCGNANAFSGKDPWLIADPWQSYQGKKHEPATIGIQEASESIRQLETKIEQAVLAKIPPQPIAMDQDDVQERVGDLEKQVQVLMNRQQQLESSVQKNHVHQSAQLTQLQSQLNAQGQQFSGQLATQQQSMQNMFEAQMSQIRSLLVKRPREEDGE